MNKKGEEFCEDEVKSAYKYSHNHAYCDDNQCQPSNFLSCWPGHLFEFI